MISKRRYSLVLSLMIVLAAVIFWSLFYGGSVSDDALHIFRFVDVTAYADEISEATVTYNGVTYEYVIDENGEITETKLTLSAAMALANAQETSQDYPATVTLTKDAEIDSTLVVTGANIKLELKNNILKLADGAQGSVIKVASDAHLTISSDTHGTGRGYSVNENGLAALDATSDNRITGGIITGGTGEDLGISGTGGGGVYVASNGTLDFVSGNILGNTADNGGGLYMANGSTVNIKRESTLRPNVYILGNKATNNGGGIFNYGGTLTLDGTGDAYNRARISNNTADERGGGIWLNNDSTTAKLAINNRFQLNNNTAKSGGALFAMSGEFTSNDFTAESNHATNGSGGALYFAQGSSAKFKGIANELMRNTASGSGGAIYATDMTIEMSMVQCSYNTATGNGGGIALEHCTASLTQVNCNYNTAYRGGGIYINGSRSVDDVIELYAGASYNNSVTTIGGEGGGGILISGGAKVKTKGSYLIYGNHCDDPDGNVIRQGSGGGVAIVGEGSEFTLEKDGKIYDNVAGYGGMGGGVYAADSAKFTMNGGEIYGHTAGSAIAVYGTGNGVPSAFINGGEIKNNTSGGINIPGYGSVSMTGGKIIGNGSFGISWVGDGRVLAISGNPVIKGNGANGKNNVLLNGSAKIEVNGKITNGCDIRFSKYQYGSAFSTELGRVFTSGYGVQNTASPSKYFTCEESLGLNAIGLGLTSEPDPTKREVTVIPGRVKLECGDETTYHADAEGAFFHVDDYDDLTEENPATITLLAATDTDGVEHVGETMEVHLGKYVVFDLNGRLVNYVAESGSVIEVINSNYNFNTALSNYTKNPETASKPIYTSLTIKDSNPNNVKHRYTVGANGVYMFDDSLIEGVEGVGTISGGVITGGKGSGSYGGAISAGEHTGDVGGAIVKLQSGTIAGNNGGSGGGIALGLRSKFEMTGGSIAGNYARYAGGGVFINGYSEFSMIAGEINNNKAGGDGGGMRAGAGLNEFYIGGTAKIHDNTAGASGGGLYFGCGKDVIIDGNAEFYGNKAAQSAGLCMFSGSHTTLTVGGNVKIYSNISNANSNYGGIYAMTNDLVIQDDVEIYGNKGHGVGITAATLTIDDNVNIHDNTGCGVHVSGNSSPAFNLQGNVDIHDNAGNGVYISGTLNLQGDVEIHNNTEAGLYVNGTLIMSGGKIYGHNTTGNGGGVILINPQDTVISGGEIYGNTSSQNGAGVYISSGRVTLSGDAKTYNNIATCDGGGISVNNATLTINGGEIYSNTARSGGGVYASVGILTIEDSANINSNTATTSGGGIFSDGRAAIIHAGGSITNNIAPTGGGVYVIHVNTYGNIYTLSGNPYIKDNKTAAENGVQSNIYLAKSVGTTPIQAVITCGELSNTTKIGVTLESVKGTFTSGYAQNNSAAPSEYFVSDNDNYAIVSDENGEGYVGRERVSVIFDGVTKVYNDVETAFKAANNCATTEENQAVVKLGYREGLGDEITETTLTVNAGSYITLNLNGQVLRAASDVNISVISVNGTLTIIDTDQTVKHLYTVDGSTGMYIINDTLTDGDSGVNAIYGGVITGGNGVAYGGAILIGNQDSESSSPAAVKLQGGTIAGNRANEAGGGVSSGSVNSAFVMTGGSIEGNYSNKDGGGLRFDCEHTFEITGGEIKNNKSGKTGGGLMVTANVHIGGTTKIHHNTAGTFGGGIYSFCRAGSSIDGNVEIYENNSSEEGGGLCFGTTSAFSSGLTIGGNAKIYSNNAPKNKTGGVYFSSGTLNLQDNAEIFDNIGRGVSLFSGTLTITGGEIRNNDCTGNGGGVYFSGSTFSMMGGNISHNTSSVHGGGVYTSGAFTLDGGEISHNTSGGAGGGIHAYYTATVTMLSGTVSENTALQGGGIYSNTWNVNTLTGGSINNNTATGVAKGLDSEDDSLGGGIRLIDSHLALGGDIEIIGNKAENGNGGGIALHTSSAVISGNVKIRNNTAKNGGGIFRSPNLPGSHSIGSSVISGNVVITGNTATEGYGGGIYYDCGINYFVGLTISGAVVIGGEDDTDANIAATAGGGVYIGINSQLTISDSEDAYPTILGNKQGAHDELSASNLYVLSGKKVVIGNSLTATASPKIGVRMQNGRGTFTTSYATTNPSTTPDKIFVADEHATKGYDIIVDENDEAFVGNERVTVTFDGDTKVYADVETAFKAANKLDTTEEKQATITLGYQDGLGDETAVATLNVNGGKYIILDLNGQILRHTGNSSVIQLNDGMLTVTDSKPEVVHKYTVNSNGLYVFDDTLDESADGVKKLTGGVITGGKKCGIYVPSAVSSNIEPYVLNLEKGTIAGNSNNGGYGGGVNVYVFNMSGGAICGNTAEYGGGVVVFYSSFIKGQDAFATITGGVIKNNTAQFGGAVYVRSDNSNDQILFKMNGDDAEIYGNTARNSGGGMYLNSNSNVVLQRGKIHGNTASGNGGGVYIHYSATLSMNGGNIYANTATISGGGIAVGEDTSVFTMTEGNIYANTAAYNGGGVYVGKGKFTMTGGEITDNQVTSKNGIGGGVYAKGNETVKLSGDITILNNTYAGNGSENSSGVLPPSNLYVDANSKVNIAGELTASDSPKIGVTVYSTPQTFTTGYNDFHSGTVPTTFFVSDRAECEVLLDGDGEVAIGVVEASVTFNGNTSKFMTVKDAFSYANTLATTAESFAVVTLLKDAEIDITATKIYAIEIESGKFIRFDLDGHVLTAVHADQQEVYDIFYVSGTFELIDGAKTKSNALTLSTGNKTIEGGVIRHAIGNANTPVGRAIYVNSGSFTMSGGTITDCIIADKGGAVYVNGGYFTMSGGTITGNRVTSSSGDGGGVYATGAEVTLNEGCVISDNKGYFGGGIFVTSHSTLIMNGGEIKDHKNGIANGGGVYVGSMSSFTMNDGSIKNNEVSAYGGGVYVISDVTLFSMIGGTISDNKGGNGGGIATYAEITIGKDAQLDNNEASNGGGIYATNETSTLFDVVVNGTLSNNTAGNGGGLYIIGKIAVKVGGTFAGNHSTSYSGGGAIRIAGSVKGEPSLTLQSGSSLTGNTAVYGGGVYVAGGTFTMSGGIIGGTDEADKNSATSYGGGVYFSGSTFVMSSGTITGNSATSYGGGIYCTQYGGTFKISGNPEIYGNTNGGNVYLESGKVINVTGALTNTQKIGITLQNGTGIFTSGYGNRNYSAPSTYFESDDDAKDVLYGYSNYNIEAAIGSAVASVDYGGFDAYNFATIKEAWDYALYIGSAKVTLLVDEVVVTRGTHLAEITGNITLELNGKTLNLNGGFDQYHYNFYQSNIKIIGGSLTIQDTSSENTGKITGGYAENGGAVYVDGGSLTLASGTISGNNAAVRDDVYNGGGVYVTNNGTFTMNDGTIGGTDDADKNTAQNGGGVYIDHGTFNMNGGTISGNTATENGGGVYANGGTFISGTIFGNTAKNGGGVYVGGMLYLGDNTNSNSKLTISGNTATEGKGGGLYFAGGPTPSIKGLVLINENTGGNLYAINNKIFNVADINNDSHIGVTLGTSSPDPYDKETGVFTSGYNKSVAPSTIFFSDNAAYTVGWNKADGQAIIGDFVANVEFGSAEGRLYSYESINTAWTDAIADANGATITLIKNVTASAALSAMTSGKVTLDLNDKTLDLNKKGHIEVNGSSAYLTIDDSGTNGTIKNGLAVNGGALYILYGTVEMKKGTITECEATSSGANYGGGGAVIVCDYATFIMNGGTITGNITATGDGRFGGGGVYVDWRATLFAVSGNAVISGNTLADKITPSNVWLYSKVITVSEALTEGAEIGVTLESGKGVITSGYGENNKDSDGKVIAPSSYFFADNGSCVWLSESNEAYLGHDIADGYHARVEKCLEEGNIEYWHCSICGKNFSDEACTTVVDSVVLEAQGHDMELTSKAATCTEDGEIEHNHCLRCDKHFSKAKDPISGEYKELSGAYVEDTENGYKSKALGHDLTTEKKESTCEEAGYIKKACARCDYSENTNLAILKHSGEIVSAKAATCKEKGNYEYFECMNGCNQYYYDQDGDHVCETSTSNKSDVEIPKLSHTEPEKPDWEWVGYTSATAKFVCPVCGETIRTETATVTSLEQAPSCTEKGKITYTATVGSYEDIKVVTTDDALGHDWDAHWKTWDNTSGEWKIEVEILCIRGLCGEVGMAKTWVTGVVTSTTEATCIATGKKVYTASVEYEDEVFTCLTTKELELAIDPNAHDIEHHDAQAATCEGIGWDEYDTCKREGCDYTTYSQIAALGHDWSTVNTDGVKKAGYTVFDKFNVSGLVLVCSRNGQHTHTYDAAKDTATVIYANDNCLHAVDTSVDVEFTVDGESKTYTYTIPVEVAKKQVTVGDAKWLSDDGSELMSGYVKSDVDGYKYYPAAIAGVTDGAIEVTNAVVRYVDGGVTVKYPDGTLYTIKYTNNSNKATVSGMKVATATLMLNDSDNYEFVAVGGAKLEDDGTLTVTKTWYAAICGNGFVSGIAGWTFGSTTVPSLPNLEKDNAESPATITLILKRDTEQIGDPFTKAEYSDYINSTMPADSYTLVATVGAVTVDDVEYAEFTHTFAFTVSAASFTVSGIDNITATYNGSLHINQTFTTSDIITAGEGIWANYPDLYSSAAITYSHANWSGTYYAKAQIAAMTKNTLFINAGTYTAQYKVSALNYVDVTGGSFNVEISRATFDLKDVRFEGNSFVYAPGEARSLAVIGLPADAADIIMVEYANNGKINVNESGTVTATLTLKDTVNYKFINSVVSNDEHIKSDTKAEYTATLTINKAKISLSLSFDDASYHYDGNSHSIELIGTLPAQVDVTYSNSVQTGVGEYDATATIWIKDAYKDNYEFAAGTKTLYEAKLTITASEHMIDLSGVKFEDKTVVYTGNPYSLFISGKLPAGVAYYYENNRCVEVDEYTVIVHFYSQNPNYSLSVTQMTAKLNIVQAKYDLNVTFPDATVAYTGNAHSLSIRGILPAGVTYEYVNNSRTEVGSQKVTVRFYGDTKNYEPIKEMTATLKVVPASLGITDVSLEGKTVTYDGNTHMLAVSGTIPNGIEVKYYVTVDGKELEFNGAMDAGAYDITAKFILPDSENYRAIRPLAARLTILATDTPVKPPIIVEPSVDEIDTTVIVNPDYDKQVPAVMGEIVQRTDFPYWIIAVCIIGVEVIAMTIIGFYILLWKPKKKKREDENGENHD